MISTISLVRQGGALKTIRSNAKWDGLRRREPSTTSKLASSQPVLDVETAVSVEGFMIDPRVWQYESKYGLHITGRLGPGPGQDGNVYRTDRATAVKFFDREERFVRENEVYRILTNKDINIIAGHAVPEWINSDSSLWVIEMTIVNRPFLLDFASARTESEVPDWEPHVLDEYYEGLREKFGENWENALHVAAMFNAATGLCLWIFIPGTSRSLMTDSA